jgi:hypothetical protein
VSDSHLPYRAHAMLWPCCSSQDHSTPRLSRDGSWATCLLSASSGYHAEFHEDCYQKHTNPPHNDPYPRLLRVVAAHYTKDDLLNCWTSSFWLPRRLSWRTRHCQSRARARHSMCELMAWHGRGTACAWHVVWIGIKRNMLSQPRRASDMSHPYFQVSTLWHINAA